MEITSNGILCDGEPVGAGFVMGNPGEPLTIFTDTNCDGENDALRHHRHLARPAGRCIDEDGNYVGERGYRSRKRDYKALEFMIDRAWDDVVVQRHVHAVVQQGQRRRPDQLGYRFRRHRPHRGVRQSVGQLRRRMAICRTTAGTDQDARRLRAQRELGGGRDAERAVGRADQRDRQAAIRSTTPTSTASSSSTPRPASTSCTRAAPKAARRGSSISART